MFLSFTVVIFIYTDKPLKGVNNKLLTSFFDKQAFDVTLRSDCFQIT